MRRIGRYTALLVLVGSVLALTSALALAAEEGEEDPAGDSTTTTISTGLVPPVEVGGGEAEPPPADWTYRYMIPTGLALAAIIIVLTAIKYFTDVVRRRYRIIEE